MYSRYDLTHLFVVDELSLFNRRALVDRSIELRVYGENFNLKIARMLINFILSGQCIMEFSILLSWTSARIMRNAFFLHLQVKVNEIAQCISFIIYGS